MHHLHERWAGVLPCILQSLGRVGFLEESEELAHFTQIRHRLFTHAECDALWRAEQISQHRDTVTLGLLEQNRGSFGLEHAVADLRHFQMGVDLDGDALELATAFELVNKVTQVGIFHRSRPKSIDFVGRWRHSPWYRRHSRSRKAYYRPPPLDRCEILRLCSISRALFGPAARRRSTF